LTETLEDFGYRVVAAAHGEDALERLGTSDSLPGVIVLDLMMPVMDGWAFREKQLQDPVLSKIPVIALSARGDVQRFDAAAHLRKPLGVDELRTTVARLLAEGSS
jgi:CheY-like chemotaxis protein